MRTVSPNEPENDNDDNDDVDEDDDKPRCKRRRGTYGVLAVASPVVLALPRPLLHVRMVDPNNNGSPTDNTLYPWFRIVTWQTYPGVLPHLMMHEVANLSTNHPRVGRTRRDSYGSTENPGTVPLSAAADITLGNSPFPQLTDV